MDSDNNTQETNNREENIKVKQADIDRRYYAILRKWGDIPSYHRTILKLIPIFIILAAIPITVRLTQLQQNYKQEAATMIPSPTPVNLQPATASSKLNFLKK